MNENVFTEISFKIESDVAHDAEAVYRTLGLDTESVLKMIMRRTVAEGGLPLTLSSERSRAILGARGNQLIDNAGKASSARNGHFLNEHDVAKILTRCDKPIPANNKVTPEMLDVIWDSYLLMRDSSTNAEIGKAIAEKSGMKSGTATIYVTFLGNLLSGNRNTYTIKVDDLRYFLRRIMDELGDAAYNQASLSLIASLPNWEDRRHGRYAEHVASFLKEIPATE